ncbi:MAG: AraC family transcriptional regulator [Spirochaetaceae bacterium]|jgi:AraC-like DNA-binding protein|nr:AraC family transcriptional regulator [Spirochaetaceae bacterium]
MRIVNEYNRIPQDCVERFVPSHVLEDTLFSQMGLRGGGASATGSGFFIKRPGNRNYHIIILTLSGKGKFVMEDDSSALTGAGDIFFSHAQGQGHVHFPHQAPWNFLWLQFYAGNAWLMPPFTDWGILPGSSKENVPRLSSIFESILTEELHIHEDGARIQQLYAELFMIYLQRELRMKENCRLGRYRARLNQLWQTVAASAGKSWSLEEMSRFAGLSRAQLSRLCLSLYRKAPGEKVREIKMEYAQALFRHFDCQVSEAAELTGYENTSNFSAAFKRYFGYSPRKARTP